MSPQPFQPPDEFESLLSTQHRTNTDLERDLAELSEDSRRAVADNQRTMQKFFGILLVVGLALGAVTAVGVVHFIQWLRSTTNSEPQPPNQSWVDTSERFRI
ncbi:hypothetical protein [Acaryochloris sp. CCMEE 5410]|uniref:hypothetical protein n=1 Tax=Acaryochloris sp. CCMEE 5410 TaxID=310037 RepID=UPI0002484040|nr:hypothetical protein [Acaryochloris sp. CCMEE 5410]KAI9130808.1 hypothetical protein ON05_024000 [Acaryochloris sp. CCMEE 5410]